MIDVEKVIREYITKTVHMSLATVRDNKPWVCEVHFAYDEGLNLYFVSKLSTRHCREIADNPSVAGNIVRQHPITDAPGGIYFEGHAELLEAPTKDDISRYCEALNRDVAEVTEMVAKPAERGMYKITIENWAAFGKFGDEPMQKYELKWRNNE